MRELIETSLAPLLKASWQGAVLVVLVLAVQRVLGRRLAPRWRYSLWLLVIIRLAVPWTLPSPASLFNLLELPAVAASRPGARATADVQSSDPTLSPPSSLLTEQPGPTLRPDAPASRGGIDHSWLLALWAAGALVFTSYLLVTHYRLSRRIRRQRPLIDDAVMNLLEDCKQEMGVRAPVTLVETGEVGSPALFGFVRPRLLLPAGLTRAFSIQELRYVFLHEVGHIKRCDILASWLVTAVQILHWFNPLVWLAFHRMRMDRELACDALALSHVGEEENQPYGDTIIRLLESFGRSAWAPSLAGAVENRNQMKERIRMIATFRKTNRGLGLATALFIGLGLVTLTDAQPSAPLAKDLVGTWVLVGAPGDIGPAPAQGGRLKSLTHTHWSITQTDPKSGLVLFHHGGTYAVKGKEYIESVDFANANTTNLVGRSFTFAVKLDGDLLTLNGIGNPWKEVWKRAVPAKATQSVPADLQGKWTGQEAGKRGASSFEVRGATLEFHGADPKEWYKASFSTYDTEPKQLVSVITECPFSQYVGRTAYAIYELNDGTLTLTGNEPGNFKVPAHFDAPGARKLVFEKKQ